jgi:hypothetical protein
MELGGGGVRAINFDLSRVLDIVVSKVIDDHSDPSKSSVLDTRDRGQPACQEEPKK